MDITNIYYSTIGMLLDTICISLPILRLFNIEQRGRLKAYLLIFIVETLFINVLVIPEIPKYLAIFIIIGLIFHKAIKIDFRYLFIMVFNFTILFMLDYISFTTFDGVTLLILSTLYKLMLIKYLRLSEHMKIRDLLSQQILTNFSLSVLIVISLLIGGVA